MTCTVRIMFAVVPHEAKLRLPPFSELRRRPKTRAQEGFLRSVGRIRPKAGEVYVPSVVFQRSSVRAGS